MNNSTNIDRKMELLLEDYRNCNSIISKEVDYILQTRLFYTTINGIFIVAGLNFFYNFSITVGFTVLGIIFNSVWWVTENRNYFYFDSRRNHLINLEKKLIKLSKLNNGKINLTWEYVDKCSKITKSISSIKTTKGLIFIFGLVWGLILIIRILIYFNILN